MKNENRRKNYMAEGKRTILIVEDEMVNRELLRMMLQEEYELVMAETGAQALTAISEQADLLSLILLDLNLPDLKGVSQVKRIIFRHNSDCFHLLLPKKTCAFPSKCIE